MKNNLKRFQKSFGYNVEYVSYDCVGFGEMNNPNTTIEVSLNDVKRVQYMRDYLDALATAIRYKLQTQQLTGE